MWETNVTLCQTSADLVTQIQYWNGTEEQYFALYDYAIANVLRALPSARVGGLDVAGGPGGEWLGRFLDHTSHGHNNATTSIGAPLDFISFHAKGAPTYVNDTQFVPGHVQMNVSASLHNVDDAFSVISSYPDYKDKPIIIGEDDPDGCAACVTAAYGYRNGLLYPSYTAVAFARDMELATRHGVNLVGALTWAFEFDDMPYFDGLRVLATNQIDKPIMNVFRMFGKLNGQQLSANSSAQLSLDTVLNDSVRGKPDVGVLAVFNETTNKLAIMVWNYHDDLLPKPDADISLTLSRVHGRWKHSQSARLTHYRIDNSHSNSYTRWLEMGAPQQPSADQVAELKASGMLQTLGEPSAVEMKGGEASLRFSLPIHAISLLVLEQGSDSSTGG